MVKIKLLGGKGEIGGNKILVEHKGTRVFLDFGMSFKQHGRFFSEFLNPRKCSALGDFFEFNLLPKMKGLYRLDYLKKTGLKPEKRLVDGVFLSHAHADHAQYIHFLRLDIPIYCTEASKIILECLEETGAGVLSEFINKKDEFCFYKNKKGGMSRVTKKQKDYVHQRDYHVMKPGKKVKIGSMEIEMVPVDHSLPGACGYIIYTDEGNIVYSGDIRFSGYNAKFSKEFVKKAKKAKPKWFICEGTRVDSDKIDSEDSVRKEIDSIISKAKGIVFIEHPIRDIDRVFTLYKCAKDNKREFVVNMKLAYLIDKLGKLSPMSLDAVKILIPKKSWGLISTDLDDKTKEGDYKTWEKPFLQRKNSITYKGLQKNPKKYVVSMTFWEINQLTDIKPKDAIWIKSTCEPFCIEMELDEERKNHWLEHFNIKKFESHCSGHACGKEIREMIKEIKPKIIVPVHTEKEKEFGEKSL